ncbi:MAG TPA: DUF370 domain-containing protein [Clostridiales bacterium]|nr:MAG: hypothetical protein BWY37_01353 [Firmicutes bacterium ADurb.Bin262]HOU09951.1 DUF370 domain-containing protein [Clostridiales bacterium]HQH63810.1 DUF370 domain-containing protein [Clostridiales bacterium]HQK73195.1 DUF370 domain-containing protein [Clostridiales bacterium]
MLLHLGKDTIINFGDIVGIFDLDTTTVSPATRNFLAKAEKEKRVVNVSAELPKSFILCAAKGGKTLVYISQISPATLLKRTGFVEGLSKTGK